MVKQVALNPNASLEPHRPYVKPRLKQDRCAYAVLNPGFYDENDKFWHPGQMLYFEGEPNQSLHPLNKLAYDKMQLFLDKVDKFGEEYARKHKKDYVPQPRQEWKDDDEIDVPQVEHLMGVPRNTKNDEIR